MLRIRWCKTGSARFAWNLAGAARDNHSGVGSVPMDPSDRVKTRLLLRPRVEPRPHVIHVAQAGSRKKFGYSQGKKARTVVGALPQIARHGAQPIEACAFLVEISPSHLRFSQSRFVMIQQ